MSRPGAGRAAAATVAALLLAAMVAWALRPGRIEGPARVEVGRAYEVRHAGDGRVRWAVVDGTVPGGPAVVAAGTLEGDRGEPVGIRRVEELRAGDPVEAGQLVARVSSTRLGADAEALAAERDALRADRALLEAGGRDDVVATRRQAVAVAEAALELEDARVAHVAGLVEQGAEGAWALDEARRQRRVRQAEVDLARARLEEARRLPRAEELERIDARLREIDALLAAARDRQQAQELRSPIAGVVGPAGGDLLVSVVDDAAPVLQIAVDEAERGRIAVGDRVEFSPTAAASRTTAGTVIAIGDEATGLGGRPVVWVVARLDAPVSPVSPGATGRATIQVGGPRAESPAQGGPGG